MKLKAIIMTSLILLLGTNVFAQDFEEKKHEIGISFGVLPTSQLINFYCDFTFMTITGGNISTEEEDVIGPIISLEYYYHPVKWLGIGASTTYVHLQENLMLSNKKIGESDYNYFSLIPTAKFDWFRKKHVGMYSKLGAGATLCLVNTPDDVKSDKEESSVFFNFQASFFGIEVGGQSLRFYSELGIGEQGLFLMGCKYKF